MTIGCKTGRPGKGVSCRGSHGQTVRVRTSDRVYRIGSLRWKRIAVGVLEQWHEKQFVGRKRRDIWTEILEALVKRDW